MFTLYIWLADIPLIPFGLAWGAVYLISRSRRMSFRFAMDFTFFFLIGSVSNMLLRITGITWGEWLVVFAVLLMAGWLGRRQDRVTGRVDILKLTKRITRQGFLVLTGVYFMLLVAWLVMAFFIG